MKKADKKVVVGMSQELYDTLKQLATEDSRSVPSYIRLLLREHTEKKQFHPCIYRGSCGIINLASKSIKTYCFHSKEGPRRERPLSAGSFQAYLPLS